MDLKLYRPTIPSFQLQQNSPQRPRDFSNSTTAPMSAFLNFTYENSNDFSSWAPPVNGNVSNMMNLSNGPFQRHIASPPPPLMNPPFHHNGFATAAPPPQHFSAGPVSGFQQPPFTNGVISPIHSPGLGQVIPHMPNNNGNTFAPPAPSYHNIPPPGPLGTRNPNQIPPPPNFSAFNNPMTGVMHHGSRGNGVGHHAGPFLTPPVSAPGSPSPPPPHVIAGSVPTQLPPLNFPSNPQTVGSRAANKSLSPPLAKSNLATSAVISRNEPSPASTNNDQSMSTTLKLKFNPNAVSFQPEARSLVIVSSTPPPKRTVTPPTKTRTHPFNPLSSHFTPSTCSTPSREEQILKRTSGKFNPDAPAFVPVSETPPLPARSSPPPNAPTGPASLVPRTSPPQGSSSIPPFPKLPLSPPTGPKADRNRIPPRPIIGLGIGMGAANEIQERGLPATTPLAPKAMSIPSGPRAERPLSRNLSSREGFYTRTYSGSEGHNPREKYAKEPAPPTVALTRIPGIDKPVPTGPAKMLADLPPAAKILDVPTAPAAMLKSMESGSQNGSDDGSRGRTGFLRRSSSHTYSRSVSIRQWRGGITHNRSSWAREDSRNASKSRDGPGMMEIEVTFHDSVQAEDKVPALTEEPESYGDESAPAPEVNEKAVQKQVEAPTTVTTEQVPIKEDDESVTVIEEVPYVEEPEAAVAVVELPLEQLVLPEVEVIASVEEADSEIAIETISPAPGLVQRPVIAIPVIEEVGMATTTPTAVITVIPDTVSLPSIQIETDDEPRKEVDLGKDLDTNFDSFPDSHAATAPSLRLSEINRKRREGESDEIGKNKDAIIASVIEGVAPVEDTEKDKKSVQDGSAILNTRREKGRKGNKGKKEKKNQATNTAKPAADAQSVFDTTTPTATSQVASEADAEAPVNQKPAHRAAIVMHGVVHQDGASMRAVAVQKNSESGVGFIAESPLPVEPMAEAEEVDAIVLDSTGEEEPIPGKVIPVLMEEAEKEAAKITLDENDNEKEHDGGVKLDAIDTLPPLPEDIDDQLVKLSEIYSDSESVKDEQDDEDVAVHGEEEPMIEVKPLQVFKAATLVQPIDQEPVVIIAPGAEAVIKEIAAIEESPIALVEEPVIEAQEPDAVVDEPVAVVKEPITAVEKPVTDVEEPIAIAQETVSIVKEPIAAIEETVVISEESPVVIELLEDLLVPAVEPPSTEEVVKEAAFFEPRDMHTGEVAVSINSIIDALTSCKDINSFSGTLETYSRVSKPGTQEERLFRELHHYAAIADPSKKDNSDNRSTRSKSSMRSVKSFFRRRAEAYPQLLSSTTSRIKAILPPFLSMTAAPAINTIPTSGTITLTDHKSPMVSTAVKSQRSRLLPKMTMSLLSRSFSTKSQQNVAA